ALLPLVNREMKALVKEGVNFLQLDEPSFACHPDDPEKFLDIVARTAEGVNAKISMHMCFGNYRSRAVGQRSYRPLFPHLARAASLPAWCRGSVSSGANCEAKGMSTPYLAIQVVMMPRDTNPFGTIFGGVILSYIDQAGAIGARREVVRAGGQPPVLVTVAVN